MNTLSPTAFAASVVDVSGHVPGSAEGCADPVCWLCGGATDGLGWRRERALPATFAAHNLAAAPASGAVCRPCAAFAIGATWQAHMSARRPAGATKVWATASWRSYSHLFVAPRGHRCPKPSAWRDILLDPPAPPFLAVITLDGQKNLIFRARVATSRDVFPVQFGEDQVVVDRSRFAECLAAFEDAYEAGFGKAEILSGRWHQANVLKAGLRRWRALDMELRRWRRDSPLLLALCSFVARRAETEVAG